MMIFLTILQSGNFRGKVFFMSIGIRNSNENGDNDHP